jgi:hypothetical protein
MRSRFTFSTSFAQMAAVVMALMAGCSSASPSSSAVSQDGGASQDGGNATSQDDYGRLCSHASDCQHGYCIYYDSVPGGGGTCTRQCSSAGDCPPNSHCLNLDNVPVTVCVPVTPCTPNTQFNDECANRDPTHPQGFSCTLDVDAPAGCSKGVVPQEWCCPLGDAGSPPCTRRTDLDMFCSGSTPDAYTCISSAYQPPASQGCQNDPVMNQWCCAM